MAKIVYLFILLFMEITVAQDDCGLFGTVENRIKDCGFKHNENFHLLSKLGNKKFWYDKNSKLSWHSPRVLTISNGSYKEIKKRCKRPYRLPKPTEIKDLFHKSNPIEKFANLFVVRNFVSAQRNFDPHKDFVRRYYNLESKNILKNPIEKRIKDFQVICVADLENLYLFERSR